MRQRPAQGPDPTAVGTCPPAPGNPHPVGRLALTRKGLGAAPAVPGPPDHTGPRVDRPGRVAECLVLCMLCL